MSNQKKYIFTQRRRIQSFLSMGRRRYYSMACHNHSISSTDIHRVWRRRLLEIQHPLPDVESQL